MWDAVNAKRVQELIEMGTGRPCPCKTGRRCPILPETLVAVPLYLQLQRNVDDVGQDPKILGAKVGVGVDSRGDRLVAQLAL